MLRNATFLLNKVLRFDGYTAYFFDSTGTYRCAVAKKALAWKLYGMYEMSPGGKIGYNKWYEEDQDVLRVSPYVFRQATLRLKAGDKIEKFFAYAEEIETEVEKRSRKQNNSESNYDDFITKINKPVFKRDSNNENAKTFDFIYVDVCVVHDWKGSKIKYINNNISRIKDIVVKHLANHPSFKKFGVPVNFLRITEATLTKDDQLHFVFELKKI